MWSFRRRQSNEPPPTLTTRDEIVAALQAHGWQNAHGVSG